MSLLSPGFKEINPEKVGTYFDQGGYVGKMGQQADQLMGIDSSYNDQLLLQMQEQASQNAWQQNTIQNRNFAASGMSGQSGVLNALKSQNATSNQANMYQAYQNALGSNMDRGLGLLGQAAQFDLAKGEAQASAYGQNITNKNNFNAAKAGNAWSAIGGIGSALIMSDKRVKENLKKVGRVKTKSGKKVNIYKYNYKGSKKTNVGVVAQEIQKSHPKAVVKNKNGIMKVNYKELFA